jgi:hypothetical protein
MTPTEIVVTYPTIALAQVHAGLAYYYDHRDEIHAAIEEEHRFVEELKAKSPPSKLQDRPTSPNARGDGLQGLLELPLNREHTALLRELKALEGAQS